MTRTIRRISKTKRQEQTTGQAAGRRRKRVRRTLAGLLAVLLLVSVLPPQVLAAPAGEGAAAASQEAAAKDPAGEAPSDAGGETESTAADPLSPEQGTLEVAPGTAAEQIPFPVLTAGGGASVLTDVAWNCDTYNPDIPGSYRFTAELPYPYHYEEGVEPATVTVTVAQPAAEDVPGAAKKADTGTPGGELQGQEAAGFLRMRKGTVTEESPLVLSSAGELLEFARRHNEGTLYTILEWEEGKLLPVRLDADVDLRTDGFTPIGTQERPYYGSFDGNGKTIAGPKVRDAGLAGLFGAVKEGSTISRLVIKDCDIEGTDVAGAIAGRNGGTIENCAVSGRVSLTGGYDAGGVAGANAFGDAKGIIRGCLSLASVEAKASGGGITGHLLGGAVENCAALPQSIRGGRNAFEISGFGKGTVTGCISWDGITGLSAGTQAGVVRHPYDALKTQAAWPACFTTEPWHYAAGMLPSLTAAEGEPFPGYMETEPLSGEGTSKSPYLITNTKDLQTFAASVQAGKSYEDRFVKLTADLDLSGIDWEPVNGFGGTFDGNKKTIQNLTVNKPDDAGVGLFGKAYGTKDHLVTVKDLYLRGADVYGDSLVGGIAGESTYMQIQGCYVDGKIRSDYKDAGGLLGFTRSSVIRECMGKAEVSSLWGAGGIVSYTEHSRIEDCYSGGSVHAQYASSIGGIVAHMETADTSLTRCYSTARISSAYGPKNGVHDGVGGVAGVTSGTCTDLMAINESMNYAAGGSAGRAVGKRYKDQGVSGIGSFGMMAVNNGMLRDRDSQGYTAGELKKKDPWKAFAGNKSWSYTEGGVPILNSLPGQLQDRSFPGWLKDDKGVSEKPDIVPDYPDVQRRRYKIKNAANLVWCALNYGELENNTMSFEADITIEDRHLLDGGLSWIPIGPEKGGSNTFLKGLKIEGNGRKVSGLRIDKNSKAGTAAFGLFSGLGETESSRRPSIKNLHIQGADIYVDASQSDTARVGGILGYGSAVVIEGCSFAGAIEGQGCDAVGGIVGEIDISKDDGILRLQPNQVSGCSASGRIVQGNNSFRFGGAGGIAGSIWQTDIRKCYNTADIAGWNAGGITGHNNVTRSWHEAWEGESHTVRFSDCYNRGSISAEFSGGGVAGRVSNSNIGESSRKITLQLTRLYNVGPVVSKGLAGGITGSMTGGAYDSNAKYTISYLYSMGRYVRGGTTEYGEATFKGAGGIVGSFFSNKYSPVRNQSGQLYTWEGTTIEEDGQKRTLSIKKDDPTNPDGTGTLSKDNILEGRGGADVWRYWAMLIVPGYDFGGGSWIYSQGQGELPILKDVPGTQNSAIPYYIKGGDRKDPGKVREIRTPQDLLDFSEFYVSGSKNELTYRLTQDIDMAGYADFTPVRNFSDTLDGNGYTIHNLSIRSPRADETEGSGLIRNTVDTGSASNGAVIKDLALIDAQVKNSSNQERVGLLVGNLRGSAKVTGCYAAPSLSSAAENPDKVHVEGKNRVGGLVGSMDNSSAAITDCYSAVNVRARDRAGGIVGEYTDTSRSRAGTVKNCFAAGTVEALAPDGAAGGIAGRGRWLTKNSGIGGNVALNRGVYAAGGRSDDRLCGRVTGGVTQADAGIQDNYAWEAMPGDMGNGQFGEARNGISQNDAQLAGSSGPAWQNFHSTVWEKKDNTTPKLKKMKGAQANYLPSAKDFQVLDQDKDGVYLIRSAQDMAAMAAMVNERGASYGKASYRLENHINMKDLPEAGLSGWKPIQNFGGVFDGNGRTISGFHLSAPDQSGEAGLFVVARGGVLRDFTLSGSLKLDGSQKGITAGLAAARSEGSIEQVTVTGSITLETGNRDSRVGAIAGYIIGSTGSPAKITGCVSEVDITVTGPGGTAGGITAQASHEAKITKCRNRGSIRSTEQQADTSRYSQGGITGTLGYKGTVSLCLNEGSITGSQAGGIAGTVGTEGASSGGMSVTRCRNTGPVTGRYNAGGIAGALYEGKITDSYCSAGEVKNSGDDKDQAAGGIAGRSDSPEGITACYSYADVTSANGAGGIAGNLTASAEIKNCAALSYAVAGGNNGPHTGRIAGRYTPDPHAARLKNNYGLDSMKQNGSNETGGTTRNGADVTREELWTEAAFWKDAAGFQLGDREEDPWFLPAGSSSGDKKLPALRGLDNADSGAMPLHLAGALNSKNTRITLTRNPEGDIPYQPKERKVTVTAAVTDADTSRQALKWKHDGGTTGGGIQGEIQPSNLEYVLTIPAGYGGTITVEAALKTNSSIKDTLTIQVKGYADAMAAEAKRIIEDTSYSFNTRNVTDENQLRQSLAAYINQCLIKAENPVRVQEADIEIQSFTAGRDGTQDEPDARDGSFAFTAELEYITASNHALGKTEQREGGIQAASFNLQPSVELTGVPAEAVPAGQTVLLGLKIRDIREPLFQWYRSMTASQTGAIKLIGETDNVLSVPTGFPGTWYYYCIVKENAAGAAQGETTSDIKGITIEKASVLLSLTASLPEAVEGDAITFTAAAQVEAPGNVQVEGMEIGFYDVKEDGSAELLGTGSVTGGIAQFTTDKLKPGTHWIEARYAGGTAAKEAISGRQEAAVYGKLAITGGDITKTYGDPAFTLQTTGGTGIGILYTSSDLDVAQVKSLGTEGRVTITGAGTVTIHATDSMGQRALVQLTVKKSPIKIQADDKQMTLPGTMPALTWSVAEGTVADGDLDDFAGSLACSGDGTEVGRYDITQGEPIAHPFYDITFLTGTLTVSYVQSIQDVLDRIAQLPESVSTREEADLVAEADLLLAGLTEEELAVMPQEPLAKLEVLKEQAGTVNHETAIIRITGADLPWYIRVEAEEIPPSDGKYPDFAGRLEGKQTLHALYQITLINTRTKEPVAQAPGGKVQASLYTEGAESLVSPGIAHLTGEEIMEYLPVTVKGDRLDFEAKSFSLYGVTKAEEPENPETPEEPGTPPGEDSTKVPEGSKPKQMPKAVLTSDRNSRSLQIWTLLLALAGAAAAAGYRRRKNM